MLVNPGAVDTTLVLPVLTFELLETVPAVLEPGAADAPVPGCTTGVGAPEITTGFIDDELELLDDLLVELELDDLFELDVLSELLPLEVEGVDELGVVVVSDDEVGPGGGVGLAVYCAIYVVSAVIGVVMSGFQPANVYPSLDGFIEGPLGAVFTATF